MSCPLISHCWGGVVIYRLPRSAILSALSWLTSATAGINKPAALDRPARAADIRYGSCTVEEPNDRRTLEYPDMMPGSVLLVCVAPVAKDLLPAGRQCVPPLLCPPATKTVLDFPEAGSEEAVGVRVVAAAVGVAITVASDRTTGCFPRTKTRSWSWM